MLSELATTTPEHDVATSLSSFRSTSSFVCVNKITYTCLCETGYKSNISIRKEEKEANCSSKTATTGQGTTS